jgi:flagellar protein FliT
MSQHRRESTMNAAEPTHDVVSLYEEVARLTAHMLSAAYRADWDRLIELEAGCVRCMESIQGCTVPMRLSDEARRQKIVLLKRILSNDRELRKLTMPWMENVGQMLGTVPQAVPGCTHPPP